MWPWPRSRKKPGAKGMLATSAASNGLPEPDQIEYGDTCIRLFWEEAKTALVIDIDGPDALAEAALEADAALAAGNSEDEEVEDDLD